MAASSGLITEPAAPSQQQQAQEVFQWLKNLPLAPEYHPTLAEFQDPIAYIFKIEKEASKFGICKIVPPVLASPKRTAIANLNRSLAARSSSGSNPSPPTFTTRQQQIGFCPRKPRPVQKPVWQSGENYTFQEFEGKARSFEKSYFRKCSSKRTTAAFSPLEIETLYWKATVDKPFSVEYANDMPGSAFSEKKTNGGKEINEGITVGETEWNMRGVSRAKGSLLRFMKEEIPGVTSPMVYVAMMFSWFAWHVEDHDLHSLNYLHMGAGKTWYGVPREAAVAFEDVVRDHGYGGELNPLVTFSVLGEKTTVMSPEVFVSAGVPCCRLVQNAGEFVVTFPRAYHSGFSHGFNCGEAANIATPEWLKVAKDAAIRRASINYPPMVSHFQLLYDLALELCTRVPVSISAKPRSSRLKDKQKSEGETLVKEQFVSNVIHNNKLLHILGKGTEVVLLPRSSSDISVCSNLRVGSQLRVNPSLGLCSNQGIIKSSKTLVPDGIIHGRNHGINQAKDILSVKEKFASLFDRNRFASLNGNDDKHAMDINTAQGDKLSDQRLFSCVTCGILSFDCIAIVQPTETAARYLMSADCTFFNDWIVGSGISNDKLTTVGGANTSDQDQPTGWVENSDVDGLYDVPVQSINYQLQKINQNKATSDNKTQRQLSVLGLLAVNYGNSSDSEEDQDEHNVLHHADEMATRPSEKNGHGHGPGCFKDGSDGTLDCSAESETKLANMDPNGLDQTHRDSVSMSHINSNFSPVVHGRVVPNGNQDTTLAHRSDEDSSRLHVFCLEHAVEVEQQFRSIGGVHILFLCHPEYPRLEAEAKIVSEELGIDYLWNDIAFRDATKSEEENIQSALDSEEAIPGNGDWAVKLGINLFYSANLSRSSLYSKQMPYNSVIYKAFGHMSPASSPTKLNIYGKRSGKQKKTVAGKWCGKVWMSNQVHPFLLKWDSEDRDQEQEQQGYVSGWKWPEERNERKPQSFQKPETTSAATKSGRKRKTGASSRPVKKVQSQETENAASDDLEEDVSHKQQTKVYSRRQTKHIGGEDSYDSLGDSHQQHWRLHGIKQAKSVERDDVGSDDLLEGNSLQQHRRKSKHVKSIVSENRISSRQHGGIHRIKSKRVKYVRRTSETSDDSLEGNMPKWRGRVHQSTQAKFYEKEEMVSDDSHVESSHQSLKMVRRCKQPLYFGNEDAISDDSVENYSLQQNISTSRGSRPKYFQAENEASDDMPEENTYRKGTESHRSVKKKFFDRESEISDHSLEDNTQQERIKAFRIKQDRFSGRGDEVSDDSQEGNFQRQRRQRRQQQKRRIPASKRAKFVESEDAVSEDMEDDSHLAHWRISRSKKAKLVGRENFSDDLHEDDAQCQRKKTSRGKAPRFLEREDASENLEEETPRQQGKMSRHKRVMSFEREGVSDDLQEEDTLWQPRKAARGKQAKFLEKEDVSDDMQEDDTHWQQRKISRGKQAKFVDPEDTNLDDLLEGNSTEQQKKRSRQKLGTLSEMKRDTLRHVKQATSLANKRENLKSIKQEKEKKLENFRLRNGKSEHGGRLFESHDEEDVEGGPSTRLRKRASKPSRGSETKVKEKLQSNKKRVKGASAVKLLAGKKNSKNKEEDAEFQCDIEGCTMSFGSKQELAVHKRNICPVKGCGKTFFSHKYLVQHRRVHLDERPLKCPWKGCKMTFKWAWARTEHIRVHTGARPYVCAEEGCGQTFRFVSDFSRHKRKTGHSVKKSRK